MPSYGKVLVFAVALFSYGLFSTAASLGAGGLWRAIAARLARFTQKFIAPDLTLRKQWGIARRSPGYLRYVWLLVKEIVLANFAVMRMILSDRDIVVPKLAVFKTTLKTRVARVVLADCITLTPGTITVHLADDEYLVHCLDESMEEGLHDSAFERRLARMEQSWAQEESHEPA